MTARRLFREADLKRALRVARAAGLDVSSFRIDPAGGIVVDSRSPAAADAYGPEAAQAALDTLGKRIDERRARRRLSRPDQAGR